MTCSWYVEPGSRRCLCGHLLGRHDGGGDPRFRAPFCFDCNAAACDAASGGYGDVCQEARPLERIQQEDAHGCAIACIAMVAGRPYRDVAKFFPRETLWRDGLNIWQTVQAFAWFGFALRMFGAGPFRGHPHELQDIPRAPVNLAEVLTARGAHASHLVVLLEGGAVLDPHTPDRTRLEDFHAVHYIAGVYRVAPWPEAAGG